MPPSASHPSALDAAWRRQKGHAARLPAAAPAERVRAAGKFLRAGGSKLYVRGVTYGTFRSGPEGACFPDLRTAERDFALMAANGVNALRTYTVPPRCLLDLAAAHGLRMLVGLPWAQHVAFLDERRLVRGIRSDVARGVRACADHPGVLAFAVGNEIPAPIVRWHGRRKIERFLEELYQQAKSEDPEALVTYVNYPTTEYLDLPFLDLVCFNVFLESRAPFERYLARLQSLSRERPLLMTEVGLDGRRHGEKAQAESLDWQLRAVFAAGCAGVFVFSWTDEWHRGGHDIADWEFGLTARDRMPKPALTAVRRAFREVPPAPDGPLPRISVVVCTYNGRATIDETLTSLSELDYPDYEVLVVNDGSTDATIQTLARHALTGVRVISTPNRGLSAARNTGWREATGEIVAYLDDDAYPDPHWLTYLAAAFCDPNLDAVGGPNVIPPDDPPVAHCVAHSPGGPTHVLIDDREAEHIPGCNMAFRRSRLEEIGGFDPRFRAAGDDVDLCWRFQERGWRIGFHPGAMVWHHRRSSLWRYWKQQVGYGKAEALLEGKWPHKYNSVGHVAWGGRIYGGGTTRALLKGRARIYQGIGGTAPFQSVYERSPGTLFSLPLMPEWYLLVAALAALTLMSPWWGLAGVAIPALLAAAGCTLIQALLTSRAATPPADQRRGWALVRFRALVALMHVAQPCARLWGRAKHGLTPWRRRGLQGWVVPWRRRREIWSETWMLPSDRLSELESALRSARVPTERGGPFDTWDMGVRGGVFGGARLLMATEEHGAGRQNLRFRTWPVLRRGAIALLVSALVIVALALLDGAMLAAAAIGSCAAVLLTGALYECGAAQATLLRKLALLERDAEAVSERRAPTDLRRPAPLLPRGGPGRRSPPPRRARARGRAASGPR